MKIWWGRPYVYIFSTIISKAIQFFLFSKVEIQNLIKNNCHKLKMFIENYFFCTWRERKTRIRFIVCNKCPFIRSKYKEDVLLLLLLLHKTDPNKIYIQKENFFAFLSQCSYVIDYCCVSPNIFSFFLQNILALCDIIRVILWPLGVWHYY